MTELIELDHLSLVEQSQFQQCEAVIEHGLQTFVDVGRALLTIRDERLYRIAYRTFEAYCLERWQMDDSRARQLIGAAFTIENLKSVTNVTPANEAQARPLVGLSPDKQRAAWQEAIDTAPDGKVTGKHVASVAEKYKNPETFLASAALDTAMPPALAINAAKEVIQEAQATNGYVTTRDGDQVEADETTLLEATLANYEERAARRSQHIQDSATVKANTLEQIEAGEEDQTTPYDGNEWYTPSRYIAAARLLMGQIDIDPASCDYAQQTVKAVRYYTKADDGLLHDWHGRVWLNPPYSYPEIERFTDCLTRQYEAGIVREAVLLVNNCTDAAWFQRLLQRYPVCFTAGRIRFERPDFEKFATRQGQAFFYLGLNEDRFAEIFTEFGVVLWRLA